jgi:hypothetical protein
MKQYTTLIALSLVATAACSRNEMNEREAKDRVDEKYEAQGDQLARQHEAEKEALDKAQEREEKTLEQNQKQAERNVEQRYDALKAGVDPKIASQMNAIAVTDITTARCAREQKCGNIGADKTYPSLDACTTSLSAELQKEFNAYDCAGGIVGKELQECLTAIRDESCNAPIEKLARIAACRDSDICNN